MKKIGIKCSFCRREYNPEKTDGTLYIKSEISGEYICSKCVRLLSDIVQLDITVH